MRRTILTWLVNSEVPQMKKQKPKKFQRFTFGNDGDVSTIMCQYAAPFLVHLFFVIFYPEDVKAKS